MDEKLRELVALSRHGLVSVFLDRTLAPGDMESEPAKLASREGTPPGTSRTHVGRTTVRHRLKPASPARESSPPCAAGATPCTPDQSAPSTSTTQPSTPPTSSLSLFSTSAWSLCASSSSSSLMRHVDSLAHHVLAAAAFLRGRIVDADHVLRAAEGSRA